ncbi:hypothetical protein GV827_15300 [Sulfitobacter sp. JBTF-M27]|uniref:Uncharacterized protein n=1 Tax=Sulfitobacter sediminilitoris TaxID=2698830 RepID=A0A6P0CH21_9RHOB|nr:hypothetical protein [Sulfitobacter sediminilitoris]NEK23764.1 hypothetical protein [Sulfitobacter sediminilitoris]
MGLKKLAAKVIEYNERLESGKASKITPSHIEKVLEKLESKTEELEANIATARSADKKARLEKKLGVARAHVERAEWLLKEIS